MVVRRLRPRGKVASLRPVEPTNLALAPAKLPPDTFVQLAPGMKKHRFDTIHRFAIWHQNGKRCYHCGEPMPFLEATIDHVIPESLLQDAQQRERVFRELNLPPSFAINDYCNWLPAHERCNKSKGAKVFRPTPLIQELLDDLQRNSDAIKAFVTRVITSQKRDTLLARLATALEADEITRVDVYAILEEPQFESNADLKVLKETLVAELENVRNEPAEFQCPHCKAPLSERGARPLSADCEVLYEAFECGYAAEDGQMERPCPSDPFFPSFEDYFLEFTEASDNRTLYCRAVPCTEMAKLLRLSPTFGRTKDEASSRMREEYDRYTRKRKSSAP